MTATTAIAYSHTSRGGPNVVRVKTLKTTPFPFPLPIPGYSRVKKNLIKMDFLTFDW
jgi:hypothetical protein